MPGSVANAPDTPYLAVDLDILERNLIRAAADAHDRGLVLRPHAKTHKSPELGRLQLQHGAVGLTLATVGEAEIFADAGFDDLFLAYPVWPSESRAARIRALVERVALRIGVDSAESARALGEVLVEVDSGHHRSGVRPSDAGALAGGAEQSARDEASAIVEAAESLSRNGIEPTVCSGGSTPSRASADSSVLTELRPGVYVYWVSAWLKWLWFYAVFTE